MEGVAEEETQFMWTDTKDNSFVEITSKCAMLAAIPAVTMFLGGLTVLSPSSPPRRLVYAMQHFAAGMLLCSIAQELVPSLTKAKSSNSIAGLLIGFSLGVMLMIGLEAFVGEHDENENDDANDVMLQSGEGGLGTPSDSDDGVGEATTPLLVEIDAVQRLASSDAIHSQQPSSAIKRAYVSQSL